MRIIALSEEVIYNIADRIFSMGKEQGKIDACTAPKFISQSKADLRYGQGNVRKWVKAGLVKRYKDADGKRNSSVRYNVMELETAAFKCNTFKDLSPRDEAERAEMVEFLNEIEKV